jgi:hypothetical protein
MCPALMLNKQNKHVFFLFQQVNPDPGSKSVAPEGILQQFVRFKRGRSSRQPAGIRGKAPDRKIHKLSQAPTHWDDVDAVKEIGQDNDFKSDKFKIKKIAKNSKTVLANSASSQHNVQTGSGRSADRLEQIERHDSSESGES